MGQLWNPHLASARATFFYQFLEFYQKILSLKIKPTESAAFVSYNLPTNSMRKR